MEAKYVGHWPTPPYYPAQTKPYSDQASVDKIIAQALIYDEFHMNGVRWVANSPEFVKEYTYRFKRAGLKEFSFTVVPAVRE